MNNIKQQINELVSESRVNEAVNLAYKLWKDHSGILSAVYLSKLFDNLAINYPEHKVAVLRSFTLEPVLTIAKAIGYLNQVHLNFWMNDFGTYMQEATNPQSSLYNFNPDTIFIAIQTRDVMPSIWNFSGTFLETAINEERVYTEKIVKQLIKSIRLQSKCNIVIHSFEYPIYTRLGIADAQTSGGQYESIEHLNSNLRSHCQNVPGTFFLDINQPISFVGKKNWYDNEKWVSAKLPIRSEHLVTLAEEWCKFLVPLAGKLAKVLVLDLDNTLWGGEVGDVGHEEIKVGTTGLGRAFLETQQAALAIRSRGILLAICSKNTYDNAANAFKLNAAMQLRLEDFSAIEINWDSKHENLNKISSCLSVAADTLVFLDDNPLERSGVRIFSPNVSVIEIAEPSDTAHSLLNHPRLNPPKITQDDILRSVYYAQEAMRKSAASGAIGPEDFLWELGITIKEVSEPWLQITRITQLINKTNQFNLRSQRYSEEQIRGFLKDELYVLQAFESEDRFGSYGIIGITLTKLSGREAILDTFLMSCRVLGRGIETAMLYSIIGKLKERNIKKLIGEYIPSMKNQLVADFFSRHRFSKTEQPTQDHFWTIDITSSNLVNLPAWVKII